MPIPINARKCPRCRKWKSRKIDFYEAKNIAYCKSCWREYRLKRSNPVILTETENASANVIQIDFRKTTAKKCSKCHCTKDLIEFTFDKSKNRFLSKCKTCSAGGFQTGLGMISLNTQFGKSKLKQKFELYLDKSGPELPLIGSCWNWLGTTSHAGYGLLYLDKLVVLAHRLSYILQVGPIPDNRFVLHKCDNSRCVRPSHIYLGTKADNCADREARGRARPRGVEASPIIRSRRGNRLESTAIKNMREQYLFGAKIETLAHRFAVNKSVVEKFVGDLMWP